MTVRFLIGDVREMLAKLPADSADCVVTSPPYWGLRDYGVAGQIGLEPTLGEHIDVMVDVWRELRRVLKRGGSAWLNYGDVHATKPNGRSAQDTKTLGDDDRTFRDKPFSTAGAIYRPDYEKTPRAGSSANLNNPAAQHGGRVEGHGPVLKPKDLCLVPARLAIALQEDGWWVHKRNVWGKTNPMPDSSGKYRPSTAHEEIFLLSKCGSPYYDAEAVALPVSGGTHARVARGGEGSARANGGTRAARPMKAVLRKREVAEREGVDRGRLQYFSPIGAADSRPPGTADRASFLQGARETWKNGEQKTRYLRDYEPPPSSIESAALDVWRIGGRPFREAHFATFPPDLAERCIRAGCPPGGGGPRPVRRRRHRRTRRRTTPPQFHLGRTEPRLRPNGQAPHCA